MFDSAGRVVAVNCDGWDFRGSEHEGAPLSYLVPVEHLLELEIDPFMVPPNSWEASQIPPSRAGQPLTIHDLVHYGHILMDPPKP